MSDDDYGDDFDEFDDYGDDDFDEPEPEPESKQQKSSQKPKVAPRVDASQFSRGQKPGGKINSYELKVRRQRAKDLRGLVSLGAESQDLLGLSKLSPYDYYLRQVKNGTVRQSSQQTKADSRGVKLQTDAIHFKTESCQVPDDLGFSGSKGGSSGTAANAMALVKFLKRAYPVCETVLEANVPASDANFQSTDTLKGTDFSLSHVKLTLPEGLGQRQAVAVVASGRSLSEFLVAYNRPSWAVAPGLAEGFRSPKSVESKAEGNDDTGCVVPESGMLCLWDAARSCEFPDRVLVCDGEITSCDISPDRGELIVAATREGSIFVWDMREDAQLHQSPEARSIGILSGLRSPSYTTDATAEPGHVASLLKVIVLATGGTSGGKSGAGDSLSLQVASLDSTGVIKIWTVIEMTNVDDAGPGVDLGMGFGSSVKLIPTATVRTHVPPKDDRAEMMALTEAAASVAAKVQQLGPGAFDAAFLPADPSLLVVASRSGSVLRRSRFGALPSPATYAPTRSNPSVRTTSIAFSPFNPNIFLVGLSTGDLALYHVDHAEAAMEWSALSSNQTHGCGDAVLKVEWSNVRACCFFVLCGDPTRTEGYPGGPSGNATGSSSETIQSTLQVWDLSRNVEEPVVRCEITSGSGAPICGLAGSRFSKRFEGRHPYIAMVDDAGALQLHVLKKEFGFPIGDEATALGTFYETCPNPGVPKVSKLKQRIRKLEKIHREVGEELSVDTKESQEEEVPGEEGVDSSAETKE